MNNFEVSKAFDFAWEKVQAINKKIDDTKPWELSKQGETEKLEAVLNELVDDLLDANEMLKPLLPNASANIEKVFTADLILPPETPLFPKN